MANTIRQIRLILISSLRVCFMAGRRSCGAARGVGSGGPVLVEAPVEALVVLMRTVRRSMSSTQPATDRTTAGLRGEAGAPPRGEDGRVQMFQEGAACLQLFLLIEQVL